MIPQPPEVTNILNVLNTWLKWKSLNGPPRGYEHYHPSAFGKCLRHMQYQRYTERGYIQVEPEAKDPKTLRIFDTGHSLHDRWARYFEEIGVLRGIWECRNECCGLWADDGKYIGDENSCQFVIVEPGYPKTSLPKPRVYGLNNKIGDFKPDSCACGSKNFTYHEVTVEDKELNFHGHCDQILDFSRFSADSFKKGNPVDVLFKQEELPQKPIVLDMKSINTNNFRTKLDVGPSLDYRTQLIIYSNILDLEYGVLIYENKDDSSTKIYKIDRNIDIWNKIREQATKMNEMVKDKLLPPPRPLSKDSYECRYCEYQPICSKAKVWDDPDLPQKRAKFYGSIEGD